MTQRTLFSVGVGAVAATALLASAAPANAQCYGGYTSSAYGPAYGYPPPRAYVNPVYSGYAPVYVEQPVYVERPIYVERPVYVAPRTYRSVSFGFNFGSSHHHRSYYPAFRHSGGHSRHYGSFGRYDGHRRSYGHSGYRGSHHGRRH